MHTDPVAALVLSLAVVLLCARLGGELAVRLKQPSVLGELVGGIVIGNVARILDGRGVHVLDALQGSGTLDVLARLGVLVLLFEVGLESTVSQMLRVGMSALLVATVGVVAPFALGWMVAAVLLPEASVYAHVFVGAALSATSVGITARVLKDIGAAATTEARIILGAAVIDDVQGLVILAVVTGLIGAANAGTSLAATAIVGVVARATLFLVGAVVVGVLLSRPVFRLAARFRSAGALLTTGLSLCFVLSWAADAIGLAPLVGAFAAGLILEDSHSREFEDRGERNLKDLVAPLSSLLSPVFFVMMGARTDVATLTDPAVLLLAGALTLAAIVGKLACGLVALRPEGSARLRRLAIGIGMIPRGEVGLIFAGLGAQLTLGGAPVIGPGVFSAVVAMVLVTTLVTPPLLRRALATPTPVPTVDEKGTPGAP